MTTNKEDFLGMSDDDFLKLNSPNSVEVTEDPGATPDLSVTDPTPVAEEKPETQDQKDDSDDTQSAAGGDDTLSGSETEPAVDPNAAKADPDPAAGKKVDAAEVLPDAKPGEKAGEPAEKGAAADNKEKAAEPVAVDYEAFYKLIMTPFKANGRMVEPRTPEEAIRLMQMGAGFGRKLQDMQPHLKTLRMLEKNNLLDESKLSYLIDLQNKNPDAIKKLIKESGLDPLDLNIEDNVVYTPHNHSVSDEEISFHTAMAEVESRPTGTETFQIINQTWDEKSKSVLWESPQLLGIIQSQRENGIYDQIVAEVDRQKTFGTIPMNEPFLSAYKIAGDALMAAGGFAKSESKTEEPVLKPTPKVLETRTETPKSVVTNSDKAKAATPSPTTPRKASQVINPLAMADDEFLKQFEGRI